MTIWKKDSQNEAKIGTVPDSVVVIIFELDY